MGIKRRKPEEIVTKLRQVEKVLKLDPYSGHLFVFRGRRGDLLKIIWWEFAPVRVSGKPPLRAVHRHPGAKPGYQKGDDIRRPPLGTPRIR